MDDGAIEVPKALQPYMGGTEIIKREKVTSDFWA
jgi:seryl-tRNA synthetase